MTGRWCRPLSSHKVLVQPWPASTSDIGCQSKQYGGKQLIVSIDRRRDIHVLTPPGKDFHITIMAASLKGIDPDLKMYLKVNRLPDVYEVGAKGLSLLLTSTLL